MSPRGSTAWHSIVAPVRHGVTRFTELTELETIEMWVTARQVIAKLEEMLRIKNFQVVINEGGYANPEQAVMMHIVPVIQGEK